MKQVRIPQGGLNLDDSVELLPAEDYTYGKNITFGRTPNGANGTVKNTRGTASLSGISELDSNSTCIGAVRDKANDETYLFFHNTTASKNCIVLVSGNTVSKVIAWDGLNFSTSYRINGAFKVGNLLYFTDNYNEPRLIDVTKYTTTPPSSEEEIKMIRRGPLYPTPFSKNTTEYNDDSIQSNRIKNYDFQFAYQYVYVDGQESVLSPFSKLAYRNVDDEDFRRIRVYLPFGSADVQWESGVDYTVWVGTTSYVIGDIVERTAEYYICLVDHTSGAFATDLAAGRWKKYSPHYDATTPSTYESLPVGVETINVCARVGNAGNWSVIERIETVSGKSYKNWSDFYNTTNGAIVRSSRTNKYDAVPRLAEGLAISKDRNWIGNILEGYNTPDIDIAFGYTSEEFDGTGQWATLTPYQMRVNYYQWNGSGWTLYQYFVDDVEPTVNPSGTGSQYFVQYNGTWYRLGESTGVDPVFDGGDLVCYDGYSGGQANAYSNQFVDENQAPSDYKTYTPVTGGWLPSTVRFQVATSADYTDYYKTKTFTSGSSYKGGILLFDESGRTIGGVITNNRCDIKLPFDTYSVRNRITWAIESNDNIPSQATHYAPVLTQNMSKLWFTEGYTSNVQYGKLEDDGTRTLSYTASDGVAAQNQTIEIDIRGWIEDGKGYDYSDSDRIVLYDVNSTTYDLEIIGQEGNYIRCAYKNIGTIPSTTPFGNYRFEIYTPAKDTLTDLFYMVGEVYPISNAGGTNPTFSVTSGELDGDAILVERDRWEYTTNIATLEWKEANIMKAIPDDTDEDDIFIWNTDIGHAALVDTIGERRLENYFRFSSTIIENTLINGLSEFEPNNIGNVSAENGAIRKLQATTKSQSEGSVLLAISEVATSSIYIGERPVNVSDGTSFMAVSDDIVSQINTQKERFGCINPESVYEWNGDVYWWDKLNRSLVRYGIHSGLFPISEYKAVSYYERQAQLNSGNVFIGYDPYYKFIFTTFETADNIDEKTLAFNTMRNKFVGFFDFAPDFYFESADKLYSVVNGTIYRHNNQAQHNTFYGTQYDSEFEVSLNDDPVVPKEWIGVGLSVSPSLLQWSGGVQEVVTDGVRVDVSNKRGQASSLIHTDFEPEEEVIYSDLLKDANTSVANPLIYGDDIFSETLQMKVTLRSDSEVSLFNSQAFFRLSKGH